MSWQSKELQTLGVGVESVWGTAVVPKYTVPFKDVKPNDNISMVANEGLRGINVVNFGNYQSIAQGEMDISGDFYPDSTGVFLKSLFGTDTLSAAVGATAGTLVSGASPLLDITALTTPKFLISVDGSDYTSVTLVITGNDTGAKVATEMQSKIRALGGVYATVTVVYTTVYTLTSGLVGAPSSVSVHVGSSNDCAVALKLTTGAGGVETQGTGIMTHLFKCAATAQPPSLTLSYNDATTSNMRNFAGHMVSDFSITWAKNAALAFDAKTIGKKSATIAASTPAVTSTVPIMAWNFSLSLAGSPNLNLAGFKLDLKRKLTPIQTANNSQDAAGIIAGGFEATGSMTFEKSDDTELDLFLNGTESAIVLTGVQAGTSYGITVTLTKATFMKAPVSGKDVIEIDCDFTGAYNTTDGGPCSIALLNSAGIY